MIETLLPPPTLLLAFCAATLLTCLTPGPAVLRVTSDALLYGAGKAQASIFGIFTGNGIYLLLAIFGLDVVLQLFPTLFLAIKIAGIGYLCWLAFGILRGLLKPAATSAHCAPTDPSAQTPSSAKLFLRSLFVQLANPKSLLYFAAILPAFVGASDHIGLRMTILGVIAELMEWVVLTSYSILCGLASAHAKYPYAQLALSLASACALMGAAALILFTSI